MNQTIKIIPVPNKSNSPDIKFEISGELYDLSFTILARELPPFDNWMQMIYAKDGGYRIIINNTNEDLIIISKSYRGKFYEISIDSRGKGHNNNFISITIPVEPFETELFSLLNLSEMSNAFSKNK